MKALIQGEQGQGLIQYTLAPFLVLPLVLCGLGGMGYLLGWSRSTSCLGLLLFFPLVWGAFWLGDTLRAHRKRRKR